jgi:hypothetical protein
VSTKPTEPAGIDLAQELKNSIERALQGRGEVETKQTGPGALIDDPSPFDTLDAWERHLADLQTLPDSIDKELAMARAQKHIQFLKSTSGRD